MSELLDFIFGQYKDYATSHIMLELIAIVASVISVLYSKNNNILVYPFGILSTAIFVYLLYNWDLIGDMIINAYYFIMSIYGWYVWTRKSNNQVTPISVTTRSEWGNAMLVFILSAVVVYMIYIAFDKLDNWINYLDIITTGIAFAGMWLMALRKLEHWLVLLVANVISVPLYFYKGYSFTAILFVFLSIIAWIGFLEWKKYHNKNTLTV